MIYSKRFQFRWNRLFPLATSKITSVSNAGFLEDEIIVLKNSVLYAKPMGPDSFLKFSLSDDISSESIKVDKPGIFASIDMIKIKVFGDWFFEETPMQQIAVLISFLDYQANNCRVILSKSEGLCSPSGILETERNFVSNIRYDGSSLMPLLISNKLRSVDYGIENLLAFVRKIENYWISHFLLSQLLKEDKDSGTDRLYNASKSYGVSESYFRKLCHNTFTRGPKKQLRIWRASHSALQLIEKEKSIATIAGDNGYASSSHFSSEIKSIFGLRPREFKSLEVVFYEK